MPKHKIIIIGTGTSQIEIAARFQKTTKCEIVLKPTADAVSEGLIRSSEVDLSTLTLQS